MLKKNNRINKTRDLRKVYRLGKAVHTSPLVIKFSASKNPTALTINRVAFVVSKKVSKKAVIRNKIKRVLREEMQKNIKAVKLGDYIIIVKYQAVTLTNPQLREQLDYALRKGNLWQK